MIESQQIWEVKQLSYLIQAFFLNRMTTDSANKCKITSTHPSNLNLTSFQSVSHFAVCQNISNSSEKDCVQHKQPLAASFSNSLLCLFAWHTSSFRYGLWFIPIESTKEKQGHTFNEREETEFLRDKEVIFFNF